VTRELVYFVQRTDCRWCGYWRRVPFGIGNTAALHAGLTARGRIVREIPRAD
jgi:hypothetical protein